MDIKNIVYRYYETDEDISSLIPSENISYFEIKDFQTSEILSSYGEVSADSTIYKNNFILQEQYSPENHNYNRGIILYSVGKFPTEIKDGETFISASVTLSSPLDAQDKYSFTENLIRYTVFPLTLLCIICAVVGFVFLMYASGRQKETEEIRPSFGVKIPLDLFLALVAGIFILGFIILVEAGALSEPQDVVIIVIYITAAISSVSIFSTAATPLSMVILILSPVSPSGTGNTLSASTFARLSSSCFAPTRIIFLNSVLFIVLCI